MSGAVVASRVRVQQHGDAMIGERVDRVYDERTGLIGEKKTTVATVPLHVQGGGTAVLVGEQITAAQVHPAPQYTTRRSYPQAIQRNDYEPVGSEKKEGFSYIGCLWLLCGCFTFTAGLAIIIAIGAAHVLTCPPLQAAGVTGFVLGAIALIMSCICCACICKNANGLSNCNQCRTCMLVTLLVLAFTGTLIANTVSVAENIEFVFSNGTYLANTTNTTVVCPAPAVSLGVMVVSYGLCILFTLFSFSSDVQGKINNA